MARKRKPGAGRKPRGPYRGNSEMLGVRVRPEIRADLEQISKERGWSLSQAVQLAIQSWIRYRRGPCGPALVSAIFKVVEQVKAETGESLEDSFTATAARLAINALMVHVWPPPLGNKPAAVPVHVKRRVAQEAAEGKLPPELQAFECTPAGVARKVAGYVITRIENAASEGSPLGLDPRVLDPEGYWEIRAGLGSGFERFQQQQLEQPKRRMK
jgi:hypothetical protein